MASRKVYTLKEENEGSIDSNSNSGSSTEQKEEAENDTRGFTESSPAVLEPSKDESRRSDGRVKMDLRRLFTRSCPEPSIQEASISCSGESEVIAEVQQRGGERQSRNELQMDAPHTNCYASCMDRYNNYVRKIRVSWFIYVLQCFMSLVCVSNIIMGMIFFKSCEGPYPSTDPALSISMGISGLIFIYKWVAKVCRQRRGEYYWNHERNKLIMYLIAFLFTAGLEIMFFTQISRGTQQSGTAAAQLQQSEKKVKCINTFYDYMYYMHVVNGGSLLLAALLHFPDCCIYVYMYQRLVPSQANGHYQPL